MNNWTRFASVLNWPCAWFAGFGMIALVACAHGEPRPLTGARAGHVLRLHGEDAGVRVVAEEHAWNGDPPNLSQYLLPVWLQIENHSGKKLWLDLSDISLQDPGNGQVVARAAPATVIKGRDRIPVSAVSPEFGLQDSWLDVWLEPGFDEHLAKGLHWQENLPTKEMLRRGIRPGVVADGGKVDGFVYFPRTKQDPSTLNLRADLVDANTKQAFGRVDIPLALLLEPSHG